MSLPQRQSCDYWKFAHAGLCGPARGFLSLAAGFIPAVYFIMFLEEAMQELKDRIVKEGKILPGNIVKVDGFLNHRVDCAFMGRIADEFKKCFDLDNVDLILTAEASGIALSAICAYR